MTATGRGRRDVAPWTEAGAVDRPSGAPPPQARLATAAKRCGLSPRNALTVTFGFGPNLFIKDGKDRYGLAASRPVALVDLPKFNGDQLIAEKTGGDISVQACADDPQVAFQAIRQLTSWREK